MGNRYQMRLVRYLKSPNRASMSDRCPHVSRSYLQSRRSSGQSYHGPHQRATAAPSENVSEKQPPHRGSTDRARRRRTRPLTSHSRLPPRRNAARHRFRFSFRRRRPLDGAGSLARTDVTLTSTPLLRMDSASISSLFYWHVIPTESITDRIEQMTSSVSQQPGQCRGLHDSSPVRAGCIRQRAVPTLVGSTTSHGVTGFSRRAPSSVARTADARS
mgnify:CR=1 FL=1